MIKKIYGLVDMLGGVDAYDFAAIESVDEFKSIVAKATMINFVDKNKKYDGGIVYGMEVLRAIENRVIPPQQMACVTFAVDCSETCTEMEKFFAAVEVAKGYYEWDGPTTD